MDDPALVLQRTFNTYKPAARNNHSVLFELIWSEDDVGNAGFVFEREKNKSLCGTRTLPRNHASRHADKIMIRQVREIVGRNQAGIAKCFTMICERVRPSGEAGAGVVGRQALI